MARKVVVVDDEKPIADILEFNLKKKDMMFTVPMMVMMRRFNLRGRTRHRIIRHHVTWS